jgi:uncharacterized protein YlxW (UPF0749 family)
MVPVVLAIMGLLVVTTARLSQGTDLRADRRIELSDLILAEDRRVDAATREVEELRTEVDQLSTSTNTPEDRELRALTAQAAIAAGLSEMQGPALVVELEDAPVPDSGIAEGFVPDDYVVHQQDLQAVINALWAGGAEGVQVMDQRIISTSAVRCVGNTLILQGRVYAPPYTVTAVGPTDRMQRALDASPGVGLYRQYADLIGLGYDVRRESSTTVAGYEGTLQLQYARATS